MTKIQKMRIHRFGGKEVLQADHIEQSFPDARQVLVVVVMRVASVNPVDFKIRSGKYPAVKADRLPYTLGRDVYPAQWRIAAFRPPGSRSERKSSA
jgi:NADPH:quinone reductase-like Zn-dependent oxidoreductase